MARTSLPGELEQTILLALAAHEEETSGGAIYDLIVESTGREMSLPAVYITLARLEDKGWAEVRSAPPAPGKGGKPRKFFKLSKDGGQILNQARTQYETLWQGAAGHPFIKNKRS